MSEIQEEFKIDDTFIYLSCSLIFMLISIYLNSKSDKQYQSKTETSNKMTIDVNDEVNLVKEYIKKLSLQVKMDSTNETGKGSKLNTVTKGNNTNAKNYPVITVVYATQSNTSKTFAENIKSESKETGLKIKIKNISEIEAQDFNTNLLLVFLVATYGEGEPTDDATDFNKKLNSNYFFKNDSGYNKQINPYLKYCVFGLGNKKYEKFNQIGKNLDLILSSKIPKLMEIGLGDDADNIRRDFEQWKSLFYENFTKHFNDLSKYNDFILKNNLNTLAEEEKEYEIKITSDRPLSNIEGFPINSKDYEYSVRSFMMGVDCKIKSISELRQNTINGSTLKIEYHLDEKLEYQTGDNIGVFPTNIERDVLFILKRLQFDPESYVNVIKHKQNISKKITMPNGLTIRQILTSFINLNAKISKQQIKELIRFVKTEEEYEALTELTTNEKVFNNYDSTNQNICDVLKHFTSITMTFMEFFNLMPKIAPRLYTVASSPNFHNGKQLDLAISLVTFTQKNIELNNRSLFTVVKEETRKGLTSGYFQYIHENYALQPNLDTRLIVRESGFKLPNNPKIPIVMIATGTGVAPFISFLQDLNSKNCKRETILIFGSKNSNSDFIYKTEIHEFLKNGYLKKLYTAFSRDTVDKFYVQHKISQHIDELKSHLVEQDGCLFICGGVSMGVEVSKTLELNFGINFIKQMENEKRIFKELWG